MTTVHLVDGTFELFRAYYGTPERDSGDGLAATRTLLASMVALLRDGATHVGVAFDHVIESFRNDLFAGYKTGEGIEPTLRAQFDIVERGCLALGMVVWPMVEFEADDALASAAKKFCNLPGVERIVICSPDKDLCQCLTHDRVVALDRIRKTILDKHGVKKKFGVDAEQIPDYLALVGDTADGIPGVPRWGAKSSALVLSAYSRLEGIPRQAEWDVKVRGAKALQQTLSDAGDLVYLYRQLATLREDCPLPESLGDLAWRGPGKAWDEFCTELGDESLRMRAWDLWKERST